MAPHPQKLRTLKCIQVKDHIDDDVVSTYGCLFGVDEVPGLLATAASPAHELRVFSTREAAINKSNGGDSLMRLCEALDKDITKAKRLLHSGGFSFQDDGLAVVVFVRADGGSTQLTNATPRSVKEASNQKNRLNIAEMAMLEHVLAFVWPREDGKPLASIKGRNQQRIRQPWVPKHLAFALGVGAKSIKSEESVETLTGKAIR